LGSVFFIPDRAGVIEHAAAQSLTYRRGVYTLALTRSRYATLSAARLAGLLVSAAGWDSVGTVRAMDVDVPIGAQPPARTSGERK